LAYAYLPLVRGELRSASQAPALKSSLPDRASVAFTIHVLPAGLK
jgi:hypothetical protein